MSGPESSAILFTRKLANRHRPTRNRVVDGEEVLWSTVVKYLGMKLYKRLTFYAHVEDLVAR